MSETLQSLPPLTPRQEIVRTCPAFEILYGGAKGGGKSFLLLFMVVLQAAIAHEHWRRTRHQSLGRAVLFRKDFTRMEDLIANSALMFKRADPGASYHVGTHRWTFSSGYRMYFIQLHEPGAEESQQGQEISLLLGDQVEEIPYKQYKYLRMQVRTTDPALRGKERIVVSANPIGEHVDWVRERWVDGKKPHDLYTDTVEMPNGKTFSFTSCFIPAKPKDNPHLSEQYWAMLSQLDEDERRAYVDGDFNVVLGSFFGDSFKERDNVIFPAAEVPKYGDLFMSGDWGSTNIASWYIHSIDGDYNISTWDEMYEPGLTGMNWGGKIIDRLKLHGIDGSRLIGYLDDNAWSDYGGESPGEKMVQMGINWFPAQKPPGSRAVGWVEMKERLRYRGGVQGRRPAWIINCTCVNLIKQLKLATKDEKKPDDIAGGTRYHALDGARYGIVQYPMPAEMKLRGQQTLDAWEQEMARREAVGARQDGRSGDGSFAGYG